MVLNHLKTMSVVEVLQADTKEDVLYAAEKQRITYALIDTFMGMAENAKKIIDEGPQMPGSKLEIV